MLDINSVAAGMPIESMLNPSDASKQYSYISEAETVKQCRILENSSLSNIVLRIVYRLKSHEAQFYSENIFALKSKTSKNSFVIMCICKKKLITLLKQA